MDQLKLRVNIWPHRVLEVIYVFFFISFSWQTWRCSNTVLMRADFDADFWFVIAENMRMSWKQLNVDWMRDDSEAARVDVLWPEQCSLQWLEYLHLIDLKNKLNAMLKRIATNFLSFDHQPVMHLHILFLNNQFWVSRQVVGLHYVKMSSTPLTLHLPFY